MAQSRDLRSGREGLGSKKGPLGWSINTADLHEMREFRRLWDLAGLLKGKVPRATEASPLYKETRALHEQLLEATRFNLGMEAALFGVEVPRGLVKFHI
mgnify:CR=1 FL=1